LSPLPFLSSLLFPYSHSFFIPSRFLCSYFLPPPSPCFKHLLLSSKCWLFPDTIIFILRDRRRNSSYMNPFGIGRGDTALRPQTGYIFMWSQLSLSLSLSEAWTAASCLSSCR
jgi:hypothetical protein